MPSAASTLSNDFRLTMGLLIVIVMVVVEDLVELFVGTVDALVLKRRAGRKLLIFCLADSIVEANLSRRMRAGRRKAETSVQPKQQHVKMTSRSQQGSKVRGRDIAAAQDGIERPLIHGV